MEYTVSKISPDNGLNGPLTAFLSTHLFMLSGSHGVHEFIVQT